MDRHVAEVTLSESFYFGKNTAQNAGLEIKVFDKGPAGKHGPQLGTIRIGQGVGEERQDRDEEWKAVADGSLRLVRICRPHEDIMKTLTDGA